MTPSRVPANVEDTTAFILGTLRAEGTVPSRHFDGITDRKLCAEAMSRLISQGIVSASNGHVSLDRARQTSVARTPSVPPAIPAPIPAPMVTVPLDVLDRITAAVERMAQSSAPRYTSSTLPPVGDPVHDGKVRTTLLSVAARLVEDGSATPGKVRGTLARVGKAPTAFDLFPEALELGLALGVLRTGERGLLVCGDPTPLVPTAVFDARREQMRRIRAAHTKPKTTDH